MADEQPAKERSVISLLDRPHPEGYREEWVERVKYAAEEDVRATVPLLVFRLLDEWLALHCDVIKEVCPASSVHRIPRRTNEVLHGVANIRGELQLAVSLRSLLGLGNRDAGSSLSRRVYQRMVLIERDRQAFAFRVDEVFGVVRFEVEEMQTVPVTVSKSLATYTRGLFRLQEQQVGLLDDDLIFHSLTNKYL